MSITFYKETKNLKIRVADEVENGCMQTVICDFLFPERSMRPWEVADPWLTLEEGLEEEEAEREVDCLRQLILEVMTS